MHQLKMYLFFGKATASLIELDDNVFEIRNLGSILSRNYVYGYQQKPEFHISVGK